MKNRAAPVDRDFPDLSLAAASRFVAALGLIFDEVGEERVIGHLELGPVHRNAAGAVHGGVYSTVVERAASVGASYAVASQGKIAVGVHNSTDIFDTRARGLTHVVALPLFRGGLQQLWAVDLRSAEDVPLAYGTLRLQIVTRRVAEPG